MSEYNSIISSLYNGISETVQPEIVQLEENVTLFSIEDFQKNIKIKHEQNNKRFVEESVNINAYDICHNCIRETIFRLLKYQPTDMTNWLPIMLKTTIGNAIHNFIQTNYDFTETEVCIKVPSKRLSVRLDCIIGNSILDEIKSCTFKDLLTITKSRRPRINDFYQALIYKYYLETHLDEIKGLPDDMFKRGNKPKQERYNFDKLQFIYVANDIFSSDCYSIKDCMDSFASIKKIFDSKHNQFYFMQVLNLDLSKIDVSDYMKNIIDKVEQINYFADNNKIPPINNDYVDKSNCFFCLYKSVCQRGEE